MAEYSSQNVDYLQSMFPSLTYDVIEDVYIAKGRNVDLTLDFLISFNEDDNTVANIVGDSSDPPVNELERSSLSVSCCSDDRTELKNYSPRDNDHVAYNTHAFYRSLEVTNTRQSTILNDSAQNSHHFTPRSYQLELFRRAKHKNSILVLGTGTGKTFISILLIREFAAEIRGRLSDGFKRTVFVVNTTPLLQQQTLVIEQQTPYRVTKFEGSRGLDSWSKQRWHEEMDKCEVAVFMAQVLYDALLNGSISFKNMNLLILDECHHATGNHPMKEFMKLYAKAKRQMHNNIPRVIGLTACVIHKKCKPQDVPKLMKELEIVMDGVLVTSTDQESIKKHATKCNICMVEYEDRMSDSSALIQAKLESTMETIKLKIASYNLRNADNLKKYYNKMHLCILAVLNDLGVFSLMQAIKLECEHFLELECSSPREKALNIELCRSFLDIATEHGVSSLKKQISPVSVSSKILRLFEIFKKIDAKSNISALVFVERRNTAKLLCQLLSAYAEIDSELTFLKPGCIIGGTGNLKEDFRLGDELGQKEVLQKFRIGEINVLVCTSILEEGLDVRRCNMVIRFDPPKNFRSYIQSLGRARAPLSHYISLVERKSMAEIHNELSCYMKINQLLTDLCHSRLSPTREESDEFLENDADIITPFEPEGPSGIRLNSDASIQLVNKYLNTLPKDDYCNASLSLETEMLGDLTRVGLTLPQTAALHIRNTVWGEPVANATLAKKSASLELCKLLYDTGELDSNLQPVVTISDPEIRTLVNGAAGADTVARTNVKQLYKRQICNAFCQGEKLFLHLIRFSPLEYVKDCPFLPSGEADHKLGLITSQALDCYSFPLYSPEFGAVLVQIEQAVPFQTSNVILADIKNFHRLVMETLFNFITETVIFAPKKCGHCVFLVPLINNGIDIYLPSYFIDKDCIFSKENVKLSIGTYNQEIVVPKYRSSEPLCVVNVLHHKSPLSPFPGGKYPSFKAYYKAVHGIDIRVDEQPLLLCKPFPKKYNFLNSSNLTRKSQENNTLLIVPELCDILVMPASLWWRIICLPSILYRLNGLCLEKDLFMSIIPNMEAYATQHKRVTYYKTNDIDDTVSDNYNICVNSSIKSTVELNPCMLLQGLTPANAQDEFNLERLETLGDSLLKFLVSKHLFVNQPCDHEGKLSIQRSGIVSNFTLCKLGKLKNIPNMIQNVSLHTFDWAVPFGFQSAISLDTTKREACVDSFSELDEYMDRKEAGSHWSYQLVSDKCIADSVEALVAVCLLVGGESAAVRYLNWLGLTFLEADVSIPSTSLIIDGSAARTEMLALYHKNCLDRLEEIMVYSFREKSFLVQAFTHASFQMNKVTDCYQRLEFLGDAVLDYLVTGYIYTRKKDFNPGKLTELRSFLVSNDNLAKIAVNNNLYRFLSHGSQELNCAILSFVRTVREKMPGTNAANNLQIPKAPKVLADIVESLIGAIFIDSGGSMHVTWKAVMKLMKFSFSDAF